MRNYQNYSYWVLGNHIALTLWSTRDKFVRNLYSHRAPVSGFFRSSIGLFDGRACECLVQSPEMTAGFSLA